MGSSIWAPYDNGWHVGNIAYYNKTLQENRLPGIIDIMFRTKTCTVLLRVTLKIPVIKYSHRESRHSRIRHFREISRIEFEFNMVLRFLNRTRLSQGPTTKGLVNEVKITCRVNNSTPSFFTRTLFTDRGSIVLKYQAK